MTGRHGMRSVNAECNGCGACCDPFICVHSPADLDLYGSRIEDIDWYRQHLTVIRRRDGRRMVADWSSGWSEMVINGRPQLLAAHYYRCDLFDPATRRCGDYEHRPAVCRGYPWYGDSPDPNKVLPPTCSYRADIGLPVAEVPVAWRARR